MGRESEGYLYSLYGLLSRLHFVPCTCVTCYKYMDLSPPRWNRAASEYKQNRCFSGWIALWIYSTQEDKRSPPQSPNDVNGPVLSTHSFYKHYLSSSNVPGTVPTSRIQLEKRSMDPALMPSQTYLPGGRGKQATKY